MYTAGMLQQGCPQEPAVAPFRRLKGSDGREARMKADIKSSQPEVKASKSVKRFQRYRQLKFSTFFPEILKPPGALSHGPPLK